MRNRERNIYRFQSLGNGVFILGICEGKQERDRDGLRLCSCNAIGERMQFLRAQARSRISPSADVRSLIPKRRSLGTSGSMRSKKKS